ncbi:MAG: hypothetical protein Q9170_000964 [Blastenia crenularia]
MSDSENDSTPVSDAQLEKALRRAVENTYKSDPEQLTVKKLRARVERDLRLNHGFFKEHVTWNARSKDVIQSEVAVQEAQSEPPTSQPAPKPSPVKNQTKSAEKPQATNGRKRPSQGDEKPQKRQKKERPSQAITSAEELDSVRQDAADTGDRQSTDSSALSDVDAKHGDTVTDEEREKKGAIDPPGEGSESELSVLIDEEPKPKKRGRKTSSEKPKSKRKEGSKSGKEQQQPSDPDAEEIKRLQGWLVKCGIRKMWYRELAPYDTYKAKIRHLRDMLTDAGMTGRYSQEKATQIREERELKADLQDVQAGNKQWGKEESNEDDNGRPKRKVARGLQELDFLRDDDGDESD